jgi:hypothetical protein
MVVIAGRNAACASTFSTLNNLPILLRPQACKEGIGVYTLSENDWKGVYMDSEETHEMKRVTSYPSGAEEWSCPDCGRRFIAQWEPKFRRVILNEGHEGIIHVGQAMGLLLQESEISIENDLEDDPELGDVWKKWLDTMNFDPDDDNDLGKPS